MHCSSYLNMAHNRLRTNAASLRKNGIKLYLVLKLSTTTLNLEQATGSAALAYRWQHSSTA